MFNKEDYKSLEKYYNILKTGILIVDTEGIIVFLNDSYSEFLELKKEDVIGKYVCNVISHTNLHNVAKTGEAQYDVWQETEKGYLFGHRIPLYNEKNELIGAMAELILRYASDIEYLTQKLNEKDLKISNLTNELNLITDTRKDIVYESEQMKKVISYSKKAALSDTTVLLTGETGVGKEVIAELIYRNSERNNMPFIKVNCSAIPANLLESEMFGYEKGAFTGADNKGKIGKFELADKGVIFLDEISSMPINMQTKLLRVLQEKEIERLGGTKPVKIDVKVIAATNISLSKLVEDNQFRKDLYYRLNVININIPPIRERREDIIPLINFFMERFCSKLNRNVLKLSHEATKILLNYSWPGNVREIKNLVERFAIVCDGPYITRKNINEHASIILTNHYNSESELKVTVNNTEKDMILKVLKKVNGNKTEAAKMLGINRTTLYSKLHKYGIDI